MADLGKAKDAPPLSPIVFIFMQFLAKIPPHNKFAPLGVGSSLGGNHGSLILLVMSYLKIVLVLHFLE